VEQHIAFVSVNSPVLFSKPLSESSGLKPVVTDPSEDPNAAPYPDVYELHMFGPEVANAAVGEFALQCWEDAENAHPLCQSSGGTPPSVLKVRVTDTETMFPDTTFTIQWDAVTCFNPWTSAACNVFSAEDIGCTCGAIVGPVPQYTLVAFEMKGVFENDDGTTQEVLIAQTPSPIALLDLLTPNIAKKLYNIPDYVVQHGSTIALAEFWDQFYDNRDLSNFLYLTGHKDEYITDKLVKGDNPNDESRPGGEALLDIEIVAAIAPNATLNFYSVADCDPYCTDEPFLNWLFFINTWDKEPELVHSVSYSDLESDYSGKNKNFLDRCDVEFVKLGLQGVTVVTPSGDDGICGWKTDEMPSADCPKAVPNYPGSSPYAVSVGATALSDKYIPICGTRWDNLFDLSIACSGVGEVVCQSDRGHKITSGGGFSEIYDRPWWQEKLLSEALEHQSQGFPSTEGFFNANGRGYPDVAVQGALWFMIDNTVFKGMSGTSSSVPMFATIVTLLNDRLLEKGLSPVGFINPLLYHLRATKPEIFNDIVVGHNACRAGHLGKKEPISCSVERFAAVPGWDAVTGLGSVNFDLLTKAVIDLKQKKAAAKAAALEQSETETATENVTGEENLIKHIEVNKPEVQSSNYMPLTVTFFMFSLILSLVALRISIKSYRNLPTQQAYDSIA